MGGKGENTSVHVREKKTKEVKKREILLSVILHQDVLIIALI